MNHVPRASNASREDLRTGRSIVNIIGDAKAEWMIKCAKRKRDPRKATTRIKQYEFNKRPRVVFISVGVLYGICRNRRIKGTKRNVRALRRSLKHREIKKFFQHEANSWPRKTIFRRARNLSRRISLVAAGSDEPFMPKRKIWLSL